MALILNIDTALETASVCIAKDGIVLSFLKNKQQKDHAGWIHEAIGDMLRESGIAIRDLDAIGVIIGPGSFTGLRIGLATAKGICYAIHKPLITCNTLYNMAISGNTAGSDLICPMIDARQMEVFAAVYSTPALMEIEKPHAVILQDNSFTALLKAHSVTFFGNGSKKFQSICTDQNAFFADFETDATHMAINSEKLFHAKDFADLAYSEPLYLKDFYRKPN